MESVNSRSKKKKKMLVNFVSVVIISMVSLKGTVEAIKCHQCNSFLEPDCMELTLSAPTGMRDNQFLQDCVGNHSEIAFCRTTSWKILASEEQRIIRACGFIPDNAAWAKEKKDYCVEADFDWMDQNICNCFEDGCNSARNLYGTVFIIVAALTLLCN